ncbi:haloacid dehalogenase type II [Microbacterium sp. GXF0217]
MNASPYVSPSTGRRVKAVLFDTFGTVVDWRSGVADAVGPFLASHGAQVNPHAFADEWRAQYEPSMQPIRSGERSFTPLDVLHRENLERALEVAGIDASSVPHDELAHLTRAWERIGPWPDSVAGIRELGRRFIVGPLSNANTALLYSMAEYGQLPWSIILGADTTRAYKPSPDAYLSMAALLRLKPGEVMLAAAHNYDLAAAREAGLATGFILRAREFGEKQTTDLEPEQIWDVHAESITDLAAQMTGAGVV